MKNTSDSYGLDETSPHDGTEHWQDTIHLLRLVQKDYHGARTQLEDISHTLAERESLVNQRLQHALLVSGGYQTLCLVPFAAGTMGSLMGRAILGGVTAPTGLPASMHLEVRCLGRFEVHSKWNQVKRWQSMRAKSVLAYLMTKPREPVIKDVLMETLWPDCNPRAASNNLKAAMHVLRRILGRLFGKKESFPYILFSQGSYLMNPQVELWLDVEEFEKHWAQGRRLEKERKFAEAVQEFEQAEALYRGDYLEDEPYEEWTLLRREALNDTYITILGKLTDHSLQTADYESCIVYCQKTLAKDPCREDAYRCLMCCYSRLGRRNRALRWYEICQRTIQAELDTSPDDETSALYRRILSNKPI